MAPGVSRSDAEVHALEARRRQRREEWGGWCHGSAGRSTSPEVEAVRCRSRARPRGDEDGRARSSSLARERAKRARPSRPRDDQDLADRDVLPDVANGFTQVNHSLDQQRGAVASTLVSSRTHTLSAPCGSGAPVMIRVACPARATAAASSPAMIVLTIESAHGATARVDRAQRVAVHRGVDETRQRFVRDDDPAATSRHASLRARATGASGTRRRGRMPWPPRS